MLAIRVGGLADTFFLLVAGVTFISGYEDVLKDEGGVGKGFTLLRDLRDTVLGILCCRYSHHLPKGDECFCGRRGEGGEDDLDLGGLRVGGRNHLPGVSRRWCDSGTRGSSSSRSGDPLGISRMTGGKSSHGMREVELSASCWSSHGMRGAKSVSSWSSHGMREVNLLLEAQVPPLVQGLDKLSVGVTAGD